MDREKVHSVVENYIESRSEKELEALHVLGRDHVMKEFTSPGASPDSAKQGLADLKDSPNTPKTQAIMLDRAISMVSDIDNIRRMLDRKHGIDVSLGEVAKEVVNCVQDQLLEGALEPEIERLQSSLGSDPSQEEILEEYLRSPLNVQSPSGHGVFVNRVFARFVLEEFSKSVPDDLLSELSQLEDELELNRFEEELITGNQDSTIETGKDTFERLTEHDYDEAMGKVLGLSASHIGKGENTP